MRKWHRWVSLSTSVIMAFIASTGLLLQLDWYFAGRSPPTGLGEPVGPGPGAPPPLPLPGGEGATGHGWIAGYTSLHNALQNLHAGYFMGTFGRWLSMLMALGLLTLSITGIVMYVQLYGARKKLGRHGFFWK